MIRLIVIACLSAAAMSAVASGGPGFDTNILAHMDAALRANNLDREDLSFAKDVDDPDFALGWTREILADPLQLPRLAEDAAAALSGIDSDPEPFVIFLYGLLEAGEPAAGKPGAIVAPAVELTAPWDKVLGDVVTELLAASEQFRIASEAVTSGDRRLLITRWIGGFFDIDDDATHHEEFMRLGLEEADISEAIQLARQIDTRSDDDAVAAIFRNLPRAGFLAAGEAVRVAAAALADEAEAGGIEWPSEPVQLETALGPVVIGTPGDDVHDGYAALIVDPGGDDRYVGDAGVANGLVGRHVAVVIDLGGNDQYRGGPVVGPGCALFGASVIIDRSGDDLYDMPGAGIAAAWAGTAWLEDGRGRDEYRARCAAQAYACAGSAVLLDREGADRYDLGLYGQGCAGPGGAAVLADLDGGDIYLAGGVEHDAERNDDRFLSMAQGASIGMRSRLGGGFGLLYDRAGNDLYTADIFGQGVGYYYACGMLLDLAGHDRYSLHQYGQGVGVHLSAGYLADLGGNDVYHGFILSQGSAHDYAVGMLLDDGGDDTYTGDHHTQGRALNNAVAMLVDTGGNDGYFARQSDGGQGIGNEGGFRDYGSLALLLDLGGADVYSTGGGDRTITLRPLYGVRYDVDPEVRDALVP